MSDQDPAWHDRSWAYRLAYYRNVLKAFLKRQVSLRRAVWGLRFPVKALLMRPPGRGFILVCPEAEQDFDHIHATNFQRQLDASATINLKGKSMSLFDDAAPGFQIGFLAATALLVLTLVISFIAILWK
jgi:hypothetical protein